MNILCHIGWHFWKPVARHTYIDASDIQSLGFSPAFAQHAASFRNIVWSGGEYNNGWKQIARKCRHCGKRG